MGLSRQGYWSGLSCPPPVDLSDPGIEPESLTSPAGYLPLVPPKLSEDSILEIFTSHK